MRMRIICIARAPALWITHLMQSIVIVTLLRAALAGRTVTYGALIINELASAVTMVLLTPIFRSVLLMRVQK